jgi:hypothetical protein
MKVKRIFFFLALALSIMGFVDIKAQTSSISKPQLAQDTPDVEEGDTPKVLSATTNSSELVEYEFFSSDSNLKNVGFLNYRNQPRDPLDSVDINGVLNYLKLVVPVIQKMEKQEIEMIEIL